MELARKADPGQASADVLPEGVNKEDLVKVDPPAPVAPAGPRYLIPEEQANVANSAVEINFCKAQVDIAVANLKLAQSQQQVIVRDALVEMGVTHKTHQITRDTEGRFFVEELKPEVKP